MLMLKFLQFKTLYLKLVHALNKNSNNSFLTLFLLWCLIWPKILISRLLMLISQAIRMMEIQQWK